MLELFFCTFAIHRGVEQLVARRAHNPKVVGSSPAPATKEASLEIERLFLWPYLKQATTVGTSFKNEVLLITTQKAWDLMPVLYQ